MLDGPISDIASRLSVSFPATVEGFRPYLSEDGTKPRWTGTLSIIENGSMLLSPSLVELAQWDPSQTLLPALSRWSLTYTASDKSEEGLEALKAGSASLSFSLSSPPDWKNQITQKALGEVHVQGCMDWENTEKSPTGLATVFTFKMSPEGKTHPIEMPNTIDGTWKTFEGNAGIPEVAGSCDLVLSLSIVDTTKSERRSLAKPTEEGGALYLPKIEEEQSGPAKAE